MRTFVTRLEAADVTGRSMTWIDSLPIDARTPSGVKLYRLSTLLQFAAEVSP